MSSPRSHRSAAPAPRPFHLDAFCATHDEPHVRTKPDLRADPVPSSGITRRDVNPPLIRSARDQPPGCRLHRLLHAPHSACIPHPADRGAAIKPCTAAMNAPLVERVSCYPRSFPLSRKSVRLEAQPLNLHDLIGTGEDFRIIRVIPSRADALDRLTRSTDAADRFSSPGWKAVGPAFQPVALRLPPHETDWKVGPTGKQVFCQRRLEPAPLRDVRTRRVPCTDTRCSALRC